jgi:hypothetical protein
MPPQGQQSARQTAGYCPNRPYRLLAFCRQKAVRRFAAMRPIHLILQ